MNDTELDEIRADFSALARKAFRAAESAARLARQRTGTRTAVQTPRRRTPDTPVDAHTPTDKEVLAARWAAAEALRDNDPAAADAWSATMSDAGVDVDELRTAPADTGGDVPRDRFTDYVADCVDDAVHGRSDSADPGEWSNWGRGGENSIGTAMAQAAAVADPAGTPATDLTAAPPLVEAAAGRDVEAGL